MPPPIAARTTTATRSPLGFKSQLPPLPPDCKPREDYQQRENDHAEERDHIHLPAAEHNAAIFGLLAGDRNQGFVRGKPVDHVQGQILVRHLTEGRVSDPTRAADYHYAGLAIDGSSRAERKRSLLVLVGIQFDRRLEIVGLKAGVGAFEEFLHALIGLHVETAGEWKHRGDAAHVLDNGRSEEQSV